MTSTSKELIPLEAVTALDVFSEGGVDKYIALVREASAISEIDLGNPKSRENIASIAYKIARTKTAFDDMGKELVADLKKKSGAIDEMRKRMRDTLDAIKDEVRKPLTDWENAEKKRLDDHNFMIKQLRDWAQFDYVPNAKEIESRIVLVVSTEQRDFEEFKEQAETVRNNTLNTLSERLAAQIKVDEDAARLRALEAENAALKAKQAEEDNARAHEAAVAAAAKKIVDDLEAKTKRDAEEKAAADKLRAEDFEHRRKINSEAFDAVNLIVLEFTEAGMPLSRAIIEAIARDQIPHVSIKY